MTGRYARWGGRSLALLCVFVCALWAFESGVGVTDREGVPGSGFLTHCYYALGLFVLGGLDLRLDAASFAKRLVQLHSLHASPRLEDGVQEYCAPRRSALDGRTAEA